MLELVIKQRRQSLGGFEVGRILPFPQRRMVGPFIFFDHVSVGRRDNASGQRRFRAGDTAR
jgi:redox-sensitive bicupin YhaK (pirin superfamily)